MSKKPSYTHDIFALKAQKEGIRARSYYKLEEIDKKYPFSDGLGQNDWVLDLGCCPGSWSQYVLKASRGRTRVLGIDLKETQDFPEFQGKFHFIQDDIEKLSESSLLNLTGGRKFSVVMSDMAPDTSGNPDRDAYLSYELVLLSWEMAKKYLIKRPSQVSQTNQNNQTNRNKGGVFIAKYFQGEESTDLLNLLRLEAKEVVSQGIFKEGKVKIFKPASSRSSSREIYLIIR